jgi:phage terminase small subunit
MARRECTEQQKAFCHEFAKDFNGTQAAIRAGYSEKSASRQAHDLLKNPLVQSYLATVTKPIIEEAMEAASYSAKQLLQDLLDVQARVKAVLVMDQEVVNEDGEYVSTLDPQLINAYARLCEQVGKHIQIGAFKEVVEHRHVGQAEGLEAAMERALAQREEYRKQLQVH